MNKMIKAFLMILFQTNLLIAQLSITNLSANFTIDFDNTVSGINNGQFNGTGLNSSPSSGQIDSDGIRVTGLSDGDATFGGTHEAGDFARGTSVGDETTGGLYSFEVSTGNYALGIQPGTGDWTPGTIEIKIDNSTGSTIKKLEISYNIYVFNNAGRSNSFNFSYSDDGSTFQSVSSIDFTSATVADGSPTWSANSKSIIISVNVSNGSTFFLRWEGDDIGGSGSRDEFALDDVIIKAESDDIDVIITEVADHTTADYTYVEVYNNNSFAIDVEGWTITERYDPDNVAERVVEFITSNQQNTNGANYLTLNSGEYLLILRNKDEASNFKTNHTINDNTAIFSSTTQSIAMTGDERYLLSDALGNAIDYFGEWNYADNSSFRVTDSKCYERKNGSSSDGQISNNWNETDNSSYTYTPGSVNTTVLPVELTNFFGYAKKGNAYLHWTTATELNNYGFLVQRSDPPISIGHPFSGIKFQAWEDVGFVPGHGTSYSEKQYSFVDHTPSVGIIRYRLKQIDLDGSYEYSNTIQINTGESHSDRFYSTAYPNPFNPTTTIIYTIPTTAINQRIRIKIYDVLGREVTTLLDKIKAPGKYKVNLDGSDLPSGVYYYSIQYEDKIIVEKIILVK